MSNILVAEDELHIAEGLKLNLELKGHKVVLKANGEDAIKSIEFDGPDLLVLDLMLPKIDGNEVLKRVREKNKKLPILVLTAKDNIEDKLECLRNGVDDYITKPFNLDEFLLRVEGLLKKLEWYDKEEQENDLITFGPNTINFKKYFATTPNGKVNLTGQEVKLMKLFSKNVNRPVTREEILQNCLGYSPDASSRTIDNFVVRFRKYFEEDPKNPKYFRSIRSVGYVFHNEIQ